MSDFNKACEKYSREGSQLDPAYRCCSCRTINTGKQLAKFGFCTNCAKRRFEEIKMMSKEEAAKLKEQGVDPLFLLLFEEATIDET